VTDTKNDFTFRSMAIGTLPCVPRGHVVWQIHYALKSRGESLQAVQSCIYYAYRSPGIITTSVHADMTAVQSKITILKHDTLK